MARASYSRMARWGVGKGSPVLAKKLAAGEMAGVRAAVLTSGRREMQKQWPKDIRRAEHVELE